MDAETIGLISGLLVNISVIPYAIRTYQGKIHPNLTSWSLWSLIGLALLLTYQSSGAEANAWPAVFGFINPTAIAILIFWRHSGWARLDRTESICLVLGLLSLVLWLMVRGDKTMAQFALYLAIAADACAAVPTIVFVWTKPDGDRPFAWTFFAIGYGLAIFAITEHTFANYALPVYMFFGAFSVAFPLARYRWRHKMHLMEWV